MASKYKRGQVLTTPNGVTIEILSGSGSCHGNMTRFDVLLNGKENRLSTSQITALMKFKNEQKGT